MGSCTHPNKTDMAREAMEKKRPNLKQDGEEAAVAAKKKQEEEAAAATTNKHEEEAAAKVKAEEAKRV